MSTGCYHQTTPKILNINLRNVTHSPISSNTRGHMFLVQISLLIVTFLSLISQVFFPLMQSIKEENPHPCIAPRVSMWSLFFFLCHILTCWCTELPYCLGRPSVRLSCEDGSCVMIPQVSHVRISYTSQITISNPTMLPLTCVAHLSAT